MCLDFSFLNNDLFMNRKNIHASAEPFKQEDVTEAALLVASMILYRFWSVYMSTNGDYFGNLYQNKQKMISKLFHEKHM